MKKLWVSALLWFFIFNAAYFDAGDPAYKGLKHCIVKYPKKTLCSLFHRPLPPGAKCNCLEGRLPEERAYNWIFDGDHGVRSRVEKIIGQVVHHKVNRIGALSLLATCNCNPHLCFPPSACRFSTTLKPDLTITFCHLTALWSRLYPQFRGYTNGPHFS